MVQILKTEDGSGKLNLETIDEGLSMILTSDNETHVTPNRRSQNNSMLKNSIKQSDSQVQHDHSKVRTSNNTVQFMDASNFDQELSNNAVMYKSKRQS